MMKFRTTDAGLSLEPCVSCGWQPVGKTKGVPSEKSANITTIGFYNRQNTSGGVPLFGYELTGTANSALIIQCFDAFADEINKSKGLKKHIVIIDNAPTHTSDAFLAKIKEWKLKNLWIQFIPAYCLELNYIKRGGPRHFVETHKIPLDEYRCL